MSASDNNHFKGQPCEGCGAKADGRNLILSFDGTSNQFGEHNTNVIELYASIIEEKEQLKYYNSGIGTYARPTFTSVKYWKQVLENKIDLLIAWNFEKVLLGGYRWLSDHYMPGDKIFLFGFSRGAYQVRALAGMINKVGLILPGNDEQIPFAYELYANLRRNSDNLHKNFKKAFARSDVRVHFLGVWDTVSSVGVVRGKTLPDTTDFNTEICYFRHALALDERRVKYLPEYICGGDTVTDNPKLARSTNGHTGDEDGPVPSKDANREHSIPRTKEVWFAGCHSDIGGGNKNNTELNNSTTPVLWMRNEAIIAGLRLDISEIKLNWTDLQISNPKNSLSLGWWFLEILPFKRLSYKKSSKHHVWSPHLGRGRVIKPGQKIHASVAFIDNYMPRANLPTEGDGGNVRWENIIRKGQQNNTDWMKKIQHVLERDLFDISDAASFIQEAIDNLQREGFPVSRLTFMARRLVFMASIRQGARAIVDNSGLRLIGMMLDSEPDKKLEEDGAKALRKLVDHVPTMGAAIVPPIDISQLLIKAMKSHQLPVRKLGINAIEVLFEDKAMRSQLMQNGCDQPLYEIMDNGGSAYNEALKAFVTFINNCEQEDSDLKVRDHIVKVSNPVLTTTAALIPKSLVRELAT